MPACCFLVTLFLFHFLTKRNQMLPNTDLKLTGVSAVTQTLSLGSPWLFVASAIFALLPDLCEHMHGLMVFVVPTSSALLQLEKRYTLKSLKQLKQTQLFQRDTFVTKIPLNWQYHYIPHQNQLALTLSVTDTIMKSKHSFGVHVWTKKTSRLAPFLIRWTY